jgi:hypothetical protein
MLSFVLPTECPVSTAFFIIYVFKVIENDHLLLSSVIITRLPELFHLLQASHVYIYRLLRGITFEIFLLSSYAFRPTMIRATVGNIFGTPVVEYLSVPSSHFRAFYSDLGMGWKIGVLLFDPRRDWEFFSPPRCPRRLWGPPCLLSNGYRGILPWG